MEATVADSAVDSSPGTWSTHTVVRLFCRPAGGRVTGPERLVVWAQAMRRGEGTIALRWRADLPALEEGAHELTFGNGHAPTQRVYIANALVPRSARVSVMGQTRSPNQHELAIAYVLAPPRPSRLVRQAVVITAATVLVWLPLGRHVRGRRRRTL